MAHSKELLPFLDLGRKAGSDVFGYVFDRAPSTVMRADGAKGGETVIFAQRRGRQPPVLDLEAQLAGGRTREWDAASEAQVALLVARLGRLAQCVAEVLQEDVITMTHEDVEEFVELCNVDEICSSKTFRSPSRLCSASRSRVKHVLTCFPAPSRCPSGL